MAAYTYTNSPVISQVQVGSTTYFIKDADVRANLDDLESKVSSLGSPMHFKGSSSQKLTDGGTQNPTKASGNLTAAEISNNSPVASGDVYLQKSGQGDGEYVWTGSKWELLGDESSYVTKGTYAVTLTPTKSTVTSTTSYQPAGTVSSPTFTGTKATIQLDSSSQGDFVQGVSGSVTLPNGTVASPTFTGTTATITSTSSYRPAGNISLTTGTPIDVIKGSDYSAGLISVSGETLTFSVERYLGYTGTVPVFTSVTPITGATFSGTTATITSTSSYQPAGTISSPSFSWGSTDSTKTISVSISLEKTPVLVSGDYTPAGTISSPTFTGTTATITVTSTVQYMTTVTGSVTL